MRRILLALLFCAFPAFAQVNIQGTGIQIGGTNSSSSGVTSINAAGASPLTGAITIACGSGLSCMQSGQTITVSVATAFSITSFTGCSTVELGTSVANPAFTASYSTTPASANITNSEGIGSPLVLVSPFTSGTVSGTFVHTTVTTTSFTLSATLGSTQTASCNEQWQPRIFGGVGSSGATSSVTASGTTAVLSTGDSLASLQLGAESVGQTFGPFNPSSQNIYLLLMGGSHTFVDAATNAPFPMNAPITVSFTNAHGAAVTMYLYCSEYQQSLPFTLKVAS